MRHAADADRVGPAPVVFGDVVLLEGLGQVPGVDAVAGFAQRAPRGPFNSLQLFDEVASVDGGVVVEDRPDVFQEPFADGLWLLVLFMDDADGGVADELRPVSTGDLRDDEQRLPHVSVTVLDLVGHLRVVVVGVCGECAALGLGPCRESRAQGFGLPADGAVAVWSERVVGTSAFHVDDDRPVGDGVGHVAYPGKAHGGEHGEIDGLDLPVLGGLGASYGGSLPVPRVDDAADLLRRLGWAACEQRVGLVEFDHGQHPVRFLLDAPVQVGGGYGDDVHGVGYQLRRDLLGAGLAAALLRAHECQPRGGEQQIDQPSVSDPEGVCDGRVGVRVGDELLAEGEDLIEQIRTVWRFCA